MTVCFFFFIGSNCPHRIESSGRNVICPREIRVFVCTSVNSYSIGWIIPPYNQIPLAFIQADLPGDINPRSLSGDAVAYLVERQVMSNNRGNRTSILYYAPAFTTIEDVNVTCFGSDVACNSTIIVFGELKFWPCSQAILILYYRQG